MFGVLPSWVGDTLTIIAIFLGTPGIVLFVLGRKGANRKLVVEEGGLTVDQFNAALPAYKDLLDRESANVAKAETALSGYESERAQIKRDLAAVKEDQRRLAILFKEVIRSNNIVLTPEQQEEFEATKPTARYETGT